MTMIWAKKVNI